MAQSLRNVESVGTPKINLVKEATSMLAERKKRKKFDIHSIMVSSKKLSSIETTFSEMEIIFTIFTIMMNSYYFEESHHEEKRNRRE